jgi:glucose/arabinose dehydrogenase
MRSWKFGAMLLPAAALIFGGAGKKIDPAAVHVGKAAFADAQSLRPGDFHKRSAADLPQPFATQSATNYPRIVRSPAGAWPQAPPGFRVELYASGLDLPRKIVTAPDGDFFVAETHLGEIKVFSGRNAAGKPEQVSTFATDLNQPFGIAFYPPGPNPDYVYIGNTDSVARFPYHNGDTKARGIVEILVSHLPTGGHSAKDLAFSNDGKFMFVAVGSRSNVRDPGVNPSEWNRAAILEYRPDGRFIGIYASGLRNPAGIGVDPDTGQVWCSVNERDGLGDNLVPDYITHVEPGGFYGRPYFYIGGNPEPRLEGRRPDLRAGTLVPDVLLQPHNASLAFAFYEGHQFPEEYRGDLFASEHGSWNRSTRSGYEVVRVPLENGHASGIYEDFVTGFVTAAGDVWGRPVGVAVSKDGSLMITDDGSKSIWRVSYAGR